MNTTKSRNADRPDLSLDWQTKKNYPGYEKQISYQQAINIP
jgi:hypothetical protein